MRAFPLVLVLALAGCGGAAVPASHVLPSAPDAAARTTDATNRGSAYGSLWVAGTTSAVEYDVAKVASGIVAPAVEIDGIDIGSSGNTNHSIVDSTVAPDGTYYALVNASTYPSDDVTNRWKLKVYPPGASGTAHYEQVITGTGRGVAVALDNNVIDVLVADGTAKARHGYVASYRYAAGDNPSPIRTLTFPYTPGYLALDPNGQMYVSNSAGSVLVYPKHLGGAAPAPVRTIALPAGSGPIFALGPAGALWTWKGPTITNLYTSFVYELSATNNGPAADLTLSLPDAIVSGLAVDQNNNVFVGFGGKVRMYPNGGTGGFVTIQTPPSSASDPAGFPDPRLAIGPSPVTASR